jgi:GNAT superfamily N-acetyltransferase
MNLSIVAVDGAGLRRRADDLQPIYRACFSAPPWREPAEEIDDYPSRLDGHAGQPGAFGYLAEVDGELLGAVYGWPAAATLPEANSFDRAVRDAVSAEVAALLVAPAVVVTELMVAPAGRGQGIGRRLLARQVAEAPRAWLATHPESGAAAMYERDGWLRRAAFQVGGQPLVLYTKG